MCKDLMILTGVIVATVMSVLWVYPMEFMTSTGCPGAILLVLFYPVTICLTFPKVMREILCRGISALCGSMRDSYRGLSRRN